VIFGVLEQFHIECFLDKFLIQIIKIKFKNQALIIKSKISYLNAYKEIHKKD